MASDAVAARVAGGSGTPTSDVPATRGDAVDPALLDVLRALRESVASVVLSLDLPGAADMRRERAAVLEVLDGYLVRRLGEQGRPLLVVIGGPTGAGKSTLLNSLLESEVTTPGVLRPTTRSPILVHHPADAEVAERLLPSLNVSTRTVSMDASVAHVEVVAHSRATPGLIVLDSPDLDSWLASNRDMAVGLLQLADIWVFVTTGTEYADGVPWELLRKAAGSRVAIATVLNRLRPAEARRVPRDFARMLVAENLRDTPVVHIPEVELVDDRIPPDYVQPIRVWLERQTMSSRLREGYIQRSVDGALDQVSASVRSLVNAAGDQVVAARRLRVDLEATFAAAQERILDRCRSAATTDALLAQWGSAPEVEVARGFDARRLRRRLTRSGPGGPDTAAVLGDLHTRLLADVAAEEIVAATIRVAERWASHPAAASFDVASLAASTTDLRHRTSDFAARWLDDVAALPIVVAQRGASGAARWSVPTLAVATAALLGRPAADPGDQASAVPDPAPAQLLSALDEPGTAAAVGPAWAALTDGVQALMAAQQERLARRIDEATMAPTISRDLRGHLQQLRALRESTRGTSAAAAQTAPTPAPAPSWATTT